MGVRSLSGRVLWVCVVEWARSVGVCRRVGAFCGCVSSSGRVLWVCVVEWARSVGVLHPEGSSGAFRRQKRRFLPARCTAPTDTALSMLAPTDTARSMHRTHGYCAVDAGRMRRPPLGARVGVTTRAATQPIRAGECSALRRVRDPRRMRNPRQPRHTRTTAACWARRPGSG
jgi:hypothetical protein